MKDITPAGYHEWLDDLTALARRYTSTRWEIADCLIRGEQKFGEMYAEGASRTGLSPDTLKQYVWVAKKFPPNDRRDDDALTFSHYQEAARLDGADHRSRVLDLASNQGWSSREMRAQVSAAIQEAKSIGAKTSKQISVPDDSEKPDPDAPIFDATGAARDLPEGHQGQGADDRPRGPLEALTSALTAINCISDLALQEAIDKDGFDRIDLLDPALAKLERVRKYVLKDSAAAGSGAADPAGGGVLALPSSPPAPVEDDFPDIPESLRRY